MCTIIYDGLYTSQVLVGDFFHEQYLVGGFNPFENY